MKVWVRVRVTDRDLLVHLSSGDLPLGWCGDLRLGWCGISRVLKHNNSLHSCEGEDVKKGD